ncbi:hypothetical protein [Candidatus Thiosymbion oneisti]|uniref:hypothetical protein n=1 Tax=Candidatus Thiosymbion oneisti TaxID=589554 RepID=UPI00105FAD8C|nr:hypothetical protein [Candidatus Thiosymbion oneisti]
MALIAQKDVTGTSHSPVLQTRTVRIRISGAADPPPLQQGVRRDDNIGTLTSAAWLGIPAEGGPRRAAES